MHNYPSDITREQFEIIRPDLEAAKRKTRPSDLYDIFCAGELEIGLLLLHSLVKA